ncbi:hypothetical protein WICPIJ_000626 [Wickerhamomyces pijperi]|uniref:protein-histidine N-methyltransferase n=1 Tax=Wickerhamomyces pijperi TaxID=599730 RepID=A0A9P8TQN6_WICPI|nr:hypothetical protein WICPIJ_000626 [Wickerhamomyces pijperi]
MSFSFGFTEDISDDEQTTAIQQSTEQISGPFVNPLDVPNPQTKPAHLESLQTLLQSLKDIRVTFESYVTPSQNTVFRRELYDVKHQLMNEDTVDQSNNNNDTANDAEDQLLLTQQSSDLTRNVYEGGFKSWECSIDTVDKLAQYQDSQLFSNKGDVIELGCGTSLPSTYLFRRALLAKIEGLKFILSDYNASVLRLVTLPNLIITWASTLPIDKLVALQRSNQNKDIPLIDDELQFTEALLQEFYADLQTRAIDIVLISGGWSRDFVNIYKSVTSENPFGVVISSETIYAPETLPILTELLVELFQINTVQRNCLQGLGFIAAKDIYFGVGGSLVEFEQNLKNVMQRENVQNWTFETIKVKAGLQRSIVLIGSN